MPQSLASLTINDDFFFFFSSPSSLPKGNVEAKFTKDRAWCPDIAKVTIWCQRQISEF